MIHTLLSLALLSAQQPSIAGTAAPVTEGQLVWADLQGDGLTDVLVMGTDGRAALFLGTEDGGFREHTALSGIDFGDGVRAARWADADGDGLPDLVVLGLGGAGRIWRNMGDASFADVTLDSGLEIPVGASAVEWVDYDRDGRLDLAAGTPDGQLLFHNLGDGRFEGVDLSAAGTFGAAAPTSAGSEMFRFSCSPGLRDVSGTGCISASSVPMLGALLPVGLELFVSPVGEVGIGTLTPSERLHVMGSVRGEGDVVAAGQLRSETTGAPPLVVTSAQRVTNLNADKLDGFDASGFTQLGSSIEGSEITDGTIGTADLGTAVVTSSKLGTGAVTNSKLGTGAVTSSKLAIGSVASPQVASGAISDAHVSPSAAIQGYKILPHFTAPVGIGTTAPSEALSVVGNIDANGSINATGTIHANLGLSSGGLISGARSYSSTTSTSAAASAYNKGSGEAGHFEIQNSSNPKAALFAKTNGSGSAAFFTSFSTTTSEPTIEAGALGNGHVFEAYQYGKAGAARLEVQNSTNTTPGALYVKTNGLGDGIQVHHSRNVTEGVYVNHTGNDGWGVWSYATGDSGVGVRAHGIGPTSYGVWGSSDNIAVVGTATVSSGLGMWSNGDFIVTGNKNFVQPHPTDASKEIVFTCLEGNESGTYFRGTAELVGGRARIEVPEEFRLVSEDDGLTVQLTPVGARVVLWVESQDLDQVVVRGDADATFHYQVNGVRRGFPETGRVRTARRFVPQVRGVPFGAQYPEALRRILVENGTLNPDFTPNEETALARGWELRDPLERDEVLLARPEIAGEAQTPAPASAQETPDELTAREPDPQEEQTAPDEAEVSTRRPVER